MKPTKQFVILNISQLRRKRETKAEFIAWQCWFPRTTQAEMPTTPRKSNIGSRRGPIKAHIPYRGDNPEVGKKTGIAVQHVERHSDGFEPFEQILQQADGRTPPRPKGMKKDLTATPHQDEEGYGSDDGWEESMQLDSMK